MKYDLQLMLGIDSIYISELNIFIHSPTLYELGLSMLSTKEIYQIIGILGVKAPQGSNITDFDAFMLVYDSLKSDVRNNLLLILDLLFPNCKISFLSGRSIYISFPENGNTIIIDKENFKFLQEAIEEIFCINRATLNNEEIEYNTKGEIANSIKEKLLKGRQERARLKAEASSNETGDRLVTNISIVSISTGIGLNEIKDFNLYQLYDILSRYELWFDFDLDLRIKLAGGDNKQKIESWTKNIH